jgi:hypothetical protein
MGHTRNTLGDSEGNGKNANEYEPKHGKTRSRHQVHDSTNQETNTTSPNITRKLNTKQRQHAKPSASNNPIQQLQNN